MIDAKKKLQSKKVRKKCPKRKSKCISKPKSRKSPKNSPKPQARSEELVPRGSFSAKVPYRKVKEAAKSEVAQEKMRKCRKASRIDYVDQNRFCPIIYPFLQFSSGSTHFFKEYLNHDPKHLRKNSDKFE